MQQLTARTLAEWLADTGREQPYLLDVREPWEYEHCHIAGSTPIPMNGVPARMAEIPMDKPVVCICHHGGRSMQVAMFLERNGFSSIYNLAGGVNAWAHDVDPAMPKY